MTIHQPRPSPAHTRARIETRRRHDGGSRAIVARSHAGADRNSTSYSFMSASYRSPAHTRARIETLAPYSRSSLMPRRPLTRGRGSKLIQGDTGQADFGRPLTRGRGSKRHKMHRFVHAAWSPAHTRARIETTLILLSSVCSTRRPLTRGRGSKRFGPARLAEEHRVARSHAGADRNLRRGIAPGKSAGRPLTRGRGSKRISVGPWKRPVTSPAHTRARIETTVRMAGLVRVAVARSHASADRNHLAAAGGRMTVTSPAHTRARIETIWRLPAAG